MLNFHDTPAIRETFLSLADQYEQLSEENAKLTDECSKIKNIIDQQIKEIKFLHQNFEKLKQDYINNTNKTFTQDQPPNDTSNMFENNNNISAIKEDVAESEVDYQINVLVPKEEIVHPLNITLFAEVVELTVVCCTSYSPDGSSIAIGSDKVLRIYNIDQDSFIFEQSLEHTTSSEFSNHIRSISWTPDSKRMICGTEDSRVRIYQIPEGSLLKRIKIGEKGIFEIQVAPNSKYFAVATGDGSLTLLSLENYLHLGTFARDVESIIASSLSISEDGSLIAVCYSDHVIGLWNPAMNNLLFENKCHDDGIFSVKFVPKKPSMLITSSLDSTIKLWNIVFDQRGIPSLNLLNVFPGHRNSVLSISISADGNWLLSGSKDKSVKLTDIQSSKMIYSIEAHNNSVISVSFSPRDNHFCTGSGDHSIKIWEFS